VIAPTEGERDATLIATGSEVHLALQARDLLAKDGIKAAVVSLPGWSEFDRQTAKYRREVLGPARAPRVAIEAAVGFGWERYLGSKGAFVGMSGFGASAPIADLYRHFGITAEATAAAVKKLI
jgi:transketolase